MFIVHLTQDEDESRDKQKLHLTDKAEWQYSDREKENLEVFYTRTYNIYIIYIYIIYII